VGDVVAAGWVENTSSSQDFAVVKLAGGNGNQLWRREIDGTAGGGDLAFALAVDSDGNVVAAGAIQNTATDNDFAVIKFSGADGVELWRKEINGSVNGSDVARGVALDAVGDVIAVGETQNSCCGASGFDFTVVKLSRLDGSEVWRAVIDGTASDTDSGLAVAIDAGGDVLSAGVLINAGTSRDFTVVKLSGATGAEVWRREIDGSANDSSFGDQPEAITVDVLGDAIAAGRIENAETGVDFFVIKLAASDGGEVWRQEIDGSANDTDSATAVAVDLQANVFAAGEVRTAISTDGEVDPVFWTTE
jgi:hypothetical protein